MRPITLKIPAGSFETLPRVGNYVRLGDGSPTVTVTDEDSGEFANLQAGDSVQFARPFRRLRVEHAEVATQTVVLDTGFGRIIAARVNGEVQPIGGAANAASPPDVYAVDVAALLAAVAGTRSPLTDLTNCTAATAVNATVTVVAAIDNVAGVRVALINLMVNSTAGLAAMTLDGGDRVALSGMEQSLVCRDLLIPAGVAVGVRSTSAGANARIVYEVLP
jgi:hypothetical protein